MAERSLKRSRTDLAVFLRSHRERLRPADVGLPGSGRRRTPGLRREEVAALAGVGLTWYTWLEQGREISVSQDLLLRISKILKLDDAECCHLFLLAQQRPPPIEARHAPGVSPLVQQMMDELERRPAYVTNLRWDVVAWNAAAGRLFGFERNGGAGVNLLRLIFTEPELRRRMARWREEAPRLLAGFRCDLAVAPQDPTMLALVEDLKKRSPDFRLWWDGPLAPNPSRGLTALLGEPGCGDSGCGDSGCSEFQHEVFTVDEHHHLHMTVYCATVGRGAGEGEAATGAQAS